MDIKLKVAIGLLVGWMLMFFFVIEEAPSARRWVPLFGFVIIGYIVYASVKLWAEAKHRSEREAWEREQEARKDQQKPPE